MSNKAKQVLQHRHGRKIRYEQQSLDGRFGGLMLYEYISRLITSG